jgi:hypothetical protein
MDPSLFWLLHYGDPRGFEHSTANKGPGQGLVVPSVCARPRLHRAAPACSMQ